MENEKKKVPPSFTIKAGVTLTIPAAFTLAFHLLGYFQVQPLSSFGIEVDFVSAYYNGVIFTLALLLFLLGWVNLLYHQPVRS